MLVAAALLVSLTAAPRLARAAPPRPIAVAVMDLKAEGVPPSVANTIAGLVVSELRRLGLFQVTSMADVRSLIQFQTDRRMAGCAADVACVAEIGGALGVAYTVAGTVGKLGELHVVDLTLTDIRRAKVVASARAEGAGMGPETLKEVGRCVRRLTRPLRRGQSGYLLVRASEEGATVRLDGEIIGVTPLPLTRVPGGLHDVELIQESFIRWTREVQVVPEESTELNAILVPSPEFAARHRRRERLRRGFAWGLAATAVLAAGGSTWMYLKAGDDSQRSDELNAKLDETPGDRDLYEQVVSTNETGRRHYALYWTLMGVSAAAVGGSLALFLTGDDPDRYEVLDNTAAGEQAPAGAPDAPGAPAPTEHPPTAPGDASPSPAGAPAPATSRREWRPQLMLSGAAGPHGPWVLLRGSF